MILLSAHRQKEVPPPKPRRPHAFTASPRRPAAIRERPAYDAISLQGSAVPGTLNCSYAVVRTVSQLHLAHARDAVPPATAQGLSAAAFMSFLLLSADKGTLVCVAHGERGPAGRACTSMGDGAERADRVRPAIAPPKHHRVFHDATVNDWFARRLSIALWRSSKCDD